MARRLALLALVLLLTPVALASDPVPPPRNSVWTVLTTVEATVRDNYATVRVIADIANRGPDPEFPFQVRVPDDAFVTGLTIERDGVVHEARIESREAARAEYDAHKAQEQTGGLVEKTRRSSVYAYLINVAEFTNVRAVLTYERYLAADRGIYNLSLEAPVSGFGQDLGARFDVRIEDAAGVAAAWGAPTATVSKDGSATLVHYAVGPRPTDASTPFEVSYTLPSTSDSGSLRTTVRDGTGYFVHRFRAPADARELPLDLVLVLDVSGSMSGQKFEQMKDAATQVLQLLQPEDRLHLGFFSGDATAPWPGLRAMTSADRKLAADEVKNALIAGGTNLEVAITHGFSALEAVNWSEEESRLPVIVILTDGQPTVGQTDRAQLRALAKSTNAHKVNVFAIAFGGDADWGFIHAIAEDGNGAALRVPEGTGAEVDLRHFLGSLTTPVLKDVAVTYAGAGAKAYRPTAPILFSGSELLVVGTFDPAVGLGAATITARGPDGARSYAATPVDAGGNVSFLPRVVAYHEIRRLQDLIDAEGARDDWVRQLTALALKHGFVTDHTSLVVTLEPRRAEATTLTDCRNCSVMVTGADADGSTFQVARSAPSTSGSSWAPSTPPTATPTSAPSMEHAMTPRASVPGVGVALAIVAAACALVLLPRKK